MAATTYQIPSISCEPDSYNGVNGQNHQDEHVEERLEPLDVTVIDYSLLTQGTPGQRCELVHELRKACESSVPLKLINHGVPGNLIKAVTEACREFYQLKEEDKEVYSSADKWSPIAWGNFHREFLRIIVHPKFHCPSKPDSLSEILLDYSTRLSEISRKITEAVSESLGLETDYFYKALKLEEARQTFATNYYAPVKGSPEGGFDVGLPPHKDNTFLTILFQDGPNGYQANVDGKWFDVDLSPGFFLVNFGSVIEVVTNEKYKASLHRSIMNTSSKRTSTVMGYGPALDAIIRPAPELLNRDAQEEEPKYVAMTYKEYIEPTQIAGKR